MLAVTVLLGRAALAADPEPLLRVEGNSECPRPDQVQREVSAWSVSSAARGTPSWRAALEQPPGRAASLQLYSPQGEAVLQRTIESDDCVALAKAFAIILEAHFLDLGLVEPREVPATEAEPMAQPEAEPEPAAEPAQPASAEATPTGPWLRASAGIGVDVALPEPGVTAAAQLQFGIVLAETWALLLAGQAALPREQSGDAVNSRVRSQSQTLAVLLSKRVTSAGPWLETYTGPSLRLSRVEAVDIDAAGELSARPAWQLGLALGLPLDREWSLRLDVVGNLLLQRDRYLIEPHGVVGQGPRTVLFAALGVDFTGP